jgi:hypothetical protein
VDCGNVAFCFLIWVWVAGWSGRRLSNVGWVKKVIDYVVNHQISDGGYTFCQGTESIAQDTYYGLAILNMLNVKFPNVEKPINFFLMS